MEDDFDWDEFLNGGLGGGVDEIGEMLLPSELSMLFGLALPYLPQIMSAWNTVKTNGRLTTSTMRGLNAFYHSLSDEQRTSFQPIADALMKMSEDFATMIDSANLSGEVGRLSQVMRNSKATVQDYGMQGLIDATVWYETEILGLKSDPFTDAIINSSLKVADIINPTRHNEYSDGVKVHYVVEGDEGYDIHEFGTTEPLVTFGSFYDVQEAIYQKYQAEENAICLGYLYGDNPHEAVQELMDGDPSNVLLHHADRVCAENVWVGLNGEDEEQWFKYIEQACDILAKEDNWHLIEEPQEKV